MPPSEAVLWSTYIRWMIENSDRRVLWTWQHMLEMTEEVWNAESV